jgi:hypothetical protein
MAGLVPAIHPLRKNFLRRMMDPLGHKRVSVFDALLPGGDGCGAPTFVMAGFVPARHVPIGDIASVRAIK